MSKTCIIKFFYLTADGSCLPIEDLWFNIPDVFKDAMGEQSAPSFSEGNLTYFQFGNVITQVVGKVQLQIQLHFQCYLLPLEP